MIDLYLDTTVTLRTPASFSGWGADPTFTDSTVAARFEQRQQLVRNSEGKEVASDARVYLPPGTTITGKSRITYGGQSYEVVAWVARRALGFDSHVVAYLGAKNFE